MTNEFKVKPLKVLNKTANTLVINANYQLFSSQVTGQAWLKNTPEPGETPVPGPWGEQIYSEQINITVNKGDDIEAVVLAAAVKQLGVTLV